MTSPNTGCHAQIIIVDNNEAPRSPALAGWCIKAEFAEATRLRSKELRRVHLAIHPCSKLQGILAKANNCIKSERRVKKNMLNHRNMSDMLF